MTNISAPSSRSTKARHRLSASWARGRTLLLPTITAILVIVAWEAVVRLRDIPEALLPAPSVVASRLWRTLPFLLVQAVPTATETIVAFVISTMLGTLLAILITASRMAREALYPNIILFQLVPKIALAPLFIVYFGIGSSSRITFSVFISFFPVVVATITGLASVDRDLLRLCRAVGATKRRVYTEVMFPAAMPSIFSGLKIAITFSIIGVIVAEFITAQAGLGYMILFAASQADMPLIFASITLLCIIGLGLYAVVALAERAVLKRYGT